MQLIIYYYYQEKLFFFVWLLIRTQLAQVQRIIRLTKNSFVKIHQVHGSNLVDIFVEGYLVCG